MQVEKTDLDSIRVQWTVFELLGGFYTLHIEAVDESAIV
jgi:hypothetical protein